MPLFKFNVPAEFATSAPSVAATVLSDDNWPQHTMPVWPGGSQSIFTRADTDNNRPIRFALGCAHLAVRRSTATPGCGTIERDAAVSNASRACRVIGKRIAEIIAGKCNGIWAKGNFEADEVPRPQEFRMETNCLGR